MSFKFHWKTRKTELKTLNRMSLEMDVQNFKLTVFKIDVTDILKTNMK